MRKRNRRIRKGAWIRLEGKIKKSEKKYFELLENLLGKKNAWLE